MLVGTPFPVKLSAFGALGRKLWIIRALVPERAPFST